MKKNLIIASISLFLIASPVYASQGNKDNENQNEQNRASAVARERAEEKKDKKQTPLIQEVVLPTITISPTPTLSIEEENDDNHKSVLGDNTSEDCDNDEDSLKNHGEFVSCVASSHPGGEEVSEAARSDMGKKSDDHEDDEPSITPSVSPTITPPLTAPATDVHLSFTTWDELKKFLTQLIQNFRFGKNHNG